MENDAIYQCNNHRDFLRKFLDERKKPGGLRGLAKKAGFKSPGHLALLISGDRKLTLRSAQLLADAFQLKGRRRALMFAYAKADSSRRESERTEALDEIFRLRSAHPQAELSTKQYAYLGTWYYPVLFCLLHQRDLSQEIDSLASRIGRDITPREIAKAVQDLSDLNLIRKNQHNRWEPVNTALTTPEDVQSAAVGQYHRNSITLSKEALSLPLEKREFNGLTISISNEKLPLVKDKIRKLRIELNEILAGDENRADVYQLNLHLFPLTGSTSLRSKKRSSPK